MSFNPKLYILVHIPKTGGKTLVKHIEKNFEDDEIIAINEAINSRFTSISYVRNYVEDLSEERKDKVKIIYGHNVCYGIHLSFPNRLCRYITFIRKPIDRLVSHYNYCYNLPRYSKEKNPLNNRYWSELYEGGELLPFAEWIDKQEQYKNFIFKFFKKRNFVMRDFYFVGLTEKSEQDFLYFYHLLGIKKFFFNQNISRKLVKLENTKHEKKERINSQNYRDVELYRQASQMNTLFKRHTNFKIHVKMVARRRKRSLFIWRIKLFLAKLRNKMLGY